MASQAATRVFPVLVLIIGLTAAPTAAQTTWYVDDDALNDPAPGDPTISDPLEDGTAAHPFDAIQEAIDASVDGDTVLVADGTYTGVGNKEIDYGGRAITVQSENGAETCVIDCEGDGRAFQFHNGETNDAALDGLTIVNGAPSIYGSTGGGILCLSASPTIKNCVLQGNRIHAQYVAGAGIACISSTAHIEDCTVTQNEAVSGWGNGGGISCEQQSAIVVERCEVSNNRGASGGGLYSDHCASLTLEDCVFANNEAAWSGGGVFHSNGGSLTVKKCRLIGNSVANEDGYGGGMCLLAAGAVVANCTISENVYGRAGGGVYSADSDVLVVNSVITDNVGTHPYFTRGGGVCVYGGHVDIRCCTLAFNIAAGGGAVASEFYHQATLTNGIIWGNIGATFDGLFQDVFYSNVQVVWTGPGNISADPHFLAPELGDFRIGANSPCIDAGSNVWLPADVADLDGDGDIGEVLPFDINDGARIVDDPIAPDTGDPNGAAGIVDMGAHEYQADCDGNGVPDSVDTAGCAAGELWCSDCNGNGWLDPCDLSGGWSADCNENGIPDECDIASGFSVDCNGNGVPDQCDLDSGASVDCNLNNTPDECDIASGFSTDCNENGEADECEAGWNTDCNTNGVADFCDIASGASEDCNGNGSPDECDVLGGVSEDCNLNGAPDECDIAAGLSTDCDGNQIPDECDLANGTLTDCDSDGSPDACEVNTYFRRSGRLTPLGDGYPQSYVTPTPLAESEVVLRFEAIGDLSGYYKKVFIWLNDEYMGAFFNSAHNCPSQPDVTSLTLSAAEFNNLTAFGGVTITMEPTEYVDPFQCDPNDSYIAVSIEYEATEGGDCNGNGEPDECDITNGTSADANGDGAPDECQDCNGNGELDPIDIQLGLSEDCNANGIPDECDIDSGLSGDCNGNGEPDECEADCNENGWADECDISDGTSLDLNANGVPDECEPDCNTNDVPDDLDIAVGTSTDCNANTIPDECDIANGTSEDCNENNFPDECDISDGASRDLNLNGVPDDCECVGDVNRDGRVDATDLALLLAYYGGTGGTPYESGDLDGDGKVRLSDLAILLAVYGSICS